LNKEDVDRGYAIAVFECRNDVIDMLRFQHKHGETHDPDGTVAKYAVTSSSAFYPSRRLADPDAGVIHG
jgi:hypothetical protein